MIGFFFYTFDNISRIITLNPIKFKSDLRPRNLLDYLLNVVIGFILVFL